MTALAQLISILNSGMNTLFSLMQGLLSALPAWLSLTIVSSVLGVLLLILFKYTSHQSAISRVRDKIKARLLAMKLFKDNIPVVLKSQVQIFILAVLLLIYSIPPMLVMILPFCLVLGQLGVWYQARPLNINEEAVVVMQLAGSENDPMPEAVLAAMEGAQVVTGPVRVPSKRQIYWQIKAQEAGIHQLEFDVDQSLIQKELSIGQGLMPVSIKRPALDLADLILYPAEKPFNETSPVRWVQINYPDRTSKLTGSGVWVIFLFVVSMAAAFAVKPFLNVKI